MIEVRHDEWEEFSKSLYKMHVFEYEMCLVVDKSFPKKCEFVWDGLLCEKVKWFFSDEKVWANYNDQTAGHPLHGGLGSGNPPQNALNIQV